MEYKDCPYILFRDVRTATEIGFLFKSLPPFCPVCGTPLSRSGELVIHHWGFGTSDQSVSEGNYRRVCQSCNVVLSKLYPSGIYPNWSIQLSNLLSSKSLSYREAAWWSKVSIKELKHPLTILGSSKRRFLVDYWIKYRVPF